MHTLEEFTPLGEATADERSRIAFGKAGVHGNERFSVAVNKHGEILLTPLASIPKREAWLWQNPGAMALVLEGLRQSAAGQTHNLGSFAEYADVNTDEDEDEADEEASEEPLDMDAHVAIQAALRGEFGGVAVVSATFDRESTVTQVNGAIEDSEPVVDDVDMAKVIRRRAAREGDTSRGEI